MADVSVTATDVKARPNATIGTGTAGAAITAGQPIYKDTSDSNKYKLADKDALAASVAAGIALHAATANQPIDFVKSGGIELGSVVKPGTIYVVSSTAGGIGTSTDIVATDYTTTVGIATATNILSVSIQAGGVVVT
jgi:hypothetical protein